jgi:hypothetical protein
VHCDYYSKPYRIKLPEDQEEFETAARFGFLNFDDREQVKWRQRQMTDLRNKLAELDSFVARHVTELEESEGGDVPLEPSTQDFWEYHYEV